MAVERETESAVDTGVDHAEEVTLSCCKLDFEVLTSVTRSGFVGAVEEDVGRYRTCTTVREGILREHVDGGSGLLVPV